MSDHENHHRRSIRLQDYDYTQCGAYFVTICTYYHLGLFGDIVDNRMIVNEWGALVESCWGEIPAHYPMAELDTFVVMPNHVHGIIVINDGNGGKKGRGMIYHAPTNTIASSNNSLEKRNFSQPIANSLSTIIGAFKAAVTRQINRLSDSPDHPVWQRNYYEHIVRSETSLNAIRAYIINNPARWTEDSLLMQT